jgi:hypothetical protein
MSNEIQNSYNYLIKYKKSKHSYKTKDKHNEQFNNEDISVDEDICTYKSKPKDKNIIDGLVKEINILKLNISTQTQRNNIIDGQIKEINLLKSNIDTKNSLNIIDGLVKEINLLKSNIKNSIDIINGKCFLKFSNIVSNLNNLENPHIFISDIVGNKINNKLVCIKIMASCCINQLQIKKKSGTIDINMTSFTNIDINKYNVHGTINIYNINTEIIYNGIITNVPDAKIKSNNACCSTLSIKSLVANNLNESSNSQIQYFLASLPVIPLHSYLNTLIIININLYHN